MSGNRNDAASHGTRSRWFQIGRFLLLLTSVVAIALLIQTMVHHRFFRCGRIDPNISLANRVWNLFVRDLARARNANQHARLLCGSHSERILPKQSPQEEGGTIEEPLALNGHARLHARFHQPSVARSKIDAGKSIVDL